MASEFIIYADESAQKGNYFSNFYGGLLIRSKDIDSVRKLMAERKQELNLYGAIKWSKVTSQYLEKYIAIMDTFFDLVAQDIIKVRIMFTQNLYVPTGLTSYHREYSYYILYYQFIKYAFGLAFSNIGGGPITLRVYLDRLPDTKEKNAQFKAYLTGLQYSTGLKRAQIKLKEDQIAEVTSHEHNLLQCLDVVLGAMQFRLNDQHLARPEGETRRGKRTIAKEQLYKHILGRIRAIYPGFNIGITTGKQGDFANLWNHSYRHWCFKPGDFILDETKKKP